MRYIAFLLLICSAAFAESDVRTAALDSKPELDKPISLTMRAAQIREVLDKVQAETGARLRPEREIADDKATVYVKNKPARDVLKALAHCFNLCWAESEIGSVRSLRLCTDRDSSAAIRQRQYDDYLAILKQFDTELQATATYLRSGQQFERPPYVQGQNMDEYWRLGQRWYATRSPDGGAMVLQFLNLSESERKDLFGGKELTFAGGAIAEEAKKHYPEATSFRFWIEPSLAGYLLQGSAQPAMEPKDWVLLTMALFDDSRYDKVVQSANEALLKDTALAKDLPALKNEEKVVKEVSKPGEGSGATPMTMSDGLLPIAQAIETPVVAQYISEYQPALPSAIKAGERLAQLCAQHKFIIERDGDFLLAKYALWHRMKDREVPEATIRRWQASSAGLPYPTFDALAEMGSMSWGQVRGTINNARYWLGMPDLSEIARCEYPLKLYASLNPTQQRTVWSGVRINVSSLKPEQQVLFMQAFEIKSRPTYAQAKDASWPQKAQFSIQDQGPGGASLVAVAQAHVLGSANLMDSVPKEFKDMPADQAYQYMLTHRKEVDELVSNAAKQFLDKIASEHPEIPRKSISIYAERECIFQLTLEDHPSTNDLIYCMKMM